MKQLNIIPNPNKIDYLGGSVKMENIDSESFSARLTDKLPEEGYVLEVTENGVEATAGGERGAFYASQTLKQLKQLDICPCVRIEDAPAFEYRAFMLDCARHMTTVENIKKLIDAAALVKMNTMHWHLTDDQGWRVEIDSHPELITVAPAAAARISASTTSQRNIPDISQRMRSAKLSHMPTTTILKLSPSSICPDTRSPCSPLSRALLQGQAPRGRYKAGHL